MSFRLLFLASLALGLFPAVTRAADPAVSAVASPAVSAVASPAADPVLDAATIEKTRTRIDGLFHRRDAPPILSREVRNPFSRAEERLAAGGADAIDPSKLAALSDRELLERLATAIQVRGIVITADHPSLIINRKLFEEGDKLQLLYGQAPVEVTIKRITRETFTLGFREAELTLRLPR
jgi:hypothetical protein